MTYKEARVYLDHVSKYGSVLGLDTIRELLRELQDPQKDLNFIHIAGTNGKGSVLAYTSSVLSEAGYRTGRYISPTVVSYLEKIQVDQIPISEDTFARLTEQTMQAIDRMRAAGKSSPTVFEIETAIAFLYFKEQHCDFVVLECGMGGESDATNIIPSPVCAVFTAVSLDHLGVLGNTLEEIARTKSGIIKPGCRVVSAPQDDEVLAVLKYQATRNGCPLHMVNAADIQILREDYLGQSISYQEYQDLPVSLPGTHQAVNATVALEVIAGLKQQGYSIPEDAIRRGFSGVRWFGRFTCLKKEPLFFVDGAHNPAAARCLRETLERCFPGKRLILVMGVFKDKDYRNIAAIMAPLAASVHTVTLPDASRSLPGQTLALVMREYCSENVPVQAEPSIDAAVEAVLQEAGGQDVIVAFGSLSYLGAVAESVEHLFMPDL